MRKSIKSILYSACVLSATAFLVPIQSTAQTTQATPVVVAQSTGKASGAKSSAADTHTGPSNPSQGGVASQPNNDRNGIGTGAVPGGVQGPSNPSQGGVAGQPNNDRTGIGTGAVPGGVQGPSNPSQGGVGTIDGTGTLPNGAQSTTQPSHGGTIANPTLNTTTPGVIIDPGAIGPGPSGTGTIAIPSASATTQPINSIAPGSPSTGTPTGGRHTTNLGNSGARSGAVNR